MYQHRQIYLQIVSYIRYYHVNELLTRLFYCIGDAAFNIHFGISPGMLQITRFVNAPLGGVSQFYS